MKKLWFKAKSYGWGWTPASIEGWVCLLIFIVAAIATSLIVSSITSSEEAFAIIFAILMLIESAILIVISYKTGEKPEWRWRGKPVRKRLLNHKHY